MGANERFIQQATRIGRKALERVGEEIRLARLARGLSQAHVAARAGTSRSKIGRIERGDYQSAPFRDLIVAAAVVGLDISIGAYPVGPPHRDRAHAALLERLRTRLHPSLRWRTEVPLPNPGDLRAWDALITGSDFRAGNEAETKVRDGQELERRVAAKQRDGAVDLIILLLSDTRSNREFVKQRGPELRAMFPVSAADALRALADGRSPGGNTLILL